MFLIPDSPPGYHSPAPSRLHLNSVEVNQDIFATLDSRSPSPIYIDTEDMFMISDSHRPSPAPSKRYSNFAIQDSPLASPSLKYIDTEDMFMVSDSPPHSEAKTFPTLAFSSVENQTDASVSIQRIEPS
jgi:hypothetical protein